MTDSNAELQDFAVEIARRGHTGPMRPMRARWEGDTLLVYPPDKDEPIRRTHGVGVNFLGLWDEPQVHWYLDMDEIGKTWRQIAAHAYGQVLRQHELVKRLAVCGIERQPEPYILDSGAANAVERSMTLNYDELSKLLDLANVPTA